MYSLDRVYRWRPGTCLYNPTETRGYNAGLIHRHTTLPHLLYRVLSSTYLSTYPKPLLGLYRKQMSGVIFNLLGRRYVKLFGYNATLEVIIYIIHVYVLAYDQCFNVSSFLA